MFCLSWHVALLCIRSSGLCTIHPEAITADDSDLSRALICPSDEKFTLYPSATTARNLRILIYLWFSAQLPEKYHAAEPLTANPQNPMYRSTDSPCHGLFGECSCRLVLRRGLALLNYDLELELVTRILRKSIGLATN